MFSNLQLIDLSVPLEHNAVSEPMPAQIRYIEHANEGRQQMEQFFGVTPDDLVYSDGQGWAIEEIHAITHTGTHVDAPYHYGATSEGKPARRIDEVPLEWCFAPGVVFDVRHIPAGRSDYRRASQTNFVRHRLHSATSRYRVATNPVPTNASRHPNISNSPGWVVKACCGWSNRECVSSASMLTL